MLLSSPAISQSGSFGLASWSGHPGAMTLPHVHDDIEVNVSTAPFEYLIGGDRVVVPAGAAMLFWAAQPHQLTAVEPGALMRWLTVPLRTLLDWRLPQPFLSRLFAGETLIAPAETFGLDDARLQRWEAELGSTAFDRRTAELDLEVHLRRIASTDGFEALQAPTAPAPDRRIELVARMADYVTTHAFGPVPVADVAAAVNLHPTYAMMLFKRVLGVTIGDYASTCRIQEAQRRLITTQDSVAAIAHDVGYPSLSQFHAKFRAVAGVSPGAYRRGRIG